MKIIHMADLHLDASLQVLKDAEKRAKRKLELLTNFSRVVSYAKEENVPVILISGDLFDKKNPSKTTKNYVIDTIKSAPEILFFYLRGNHDEMCELTEEQMPNLVTFSSDFSCYQLGKNITVSGMEFISGSDSFHYEKILLPENKVNILMLHGEVTSNTKEKEYVIYPALLKNRNISYGALGHIHSYEQMILEGNTVMCYPGTLEAHGFDECSEHGFILLDVNEDLHTVKPKFIPFEKRALRELRADVSECMTTTEAYELLCMSIEEAKLTQDDMLKLVLTGEKDADSEIDPMLLEKMFSDYFMVRVYDETRVYVDVKKYLLDESLKGEFVRKVLSDETLSEEEKMTVISYGFLSLRNEEILL